VCLNHAKKSGLSSADICFNDVHAAPSVGEKLQLKKV
jgi:hypothetical protein